MAQLNSPSYLRSTLSVAAAIHSFFSLSSTHLSLSTMRSILIAVLLLSLAVSALAGEARFPTFASTSPLESKTLPTKFEQLPEETLPTKQLEDVINKQYVDQEILQVTATYIPTHNSQPTERCQY